MKKTQWRNLMPGFFEALNNLEPKKPKKHYVKIEGVDVEVNLKQKLEIQQVGEANYFCQQMANGMIVCRKPIVPKEQKQPVLIKADEGIQLLDKNPFWPVGQGKKGYKWQIK